MEDQKYLTKASQFLNASLGGGASYSAAMKSLVHYLRFKDRQVSEVLELLKKAPSKNDTLDTVREWEADRDELLERLDQ